MEHKKPPLDREVHPVRVGSCSFTLPSSINWCCDEGYDDAMDQLLCTIVPQVRGGINTQFAIRSLLRKKRRFAPIAPS
jgi:hypothetical protein